MKLEPATVTSTNPLRVRTGAEGSSDLSARLLGRGDSYAPVEGSRVIVVWVGPTGPVYVLGAA